MLVVSEIVDVVDEDIFLQRSASDSKRRCLSSRVKTLSKYEAGGLASIRGEPHHGDRSLLDQIGVGGGLTARKIEWKTRRYFC